MESLKNKLLANCYQYVQQRIDSAQQAMKHAQDSANAEEKSSAGDKYETGRAMAQIERDNAAHQLEEALKIKSALSQISSDSKSNKVSRGSLVITDAHRFYLAISVGKQSIDGVDFLIVAPDSPIGKTLLNLSVGDQFIFNKKTHTIQEIL